MGFLNPPSLVIILALFFRPSLALVTVQVHRRWCPPLATILLALVLASCVASCSAWRNFSPEAERVAEELGETLAPITLKQGVLSWRHDASLPATSRFGEKAVVQVIDSGSVLESAAQQAIAEYDVAMGVLVYPTGVSYWIRNEDNTPLVKTMISQEQFRKVENDLEWDKKALKTLALTGVIWASPVLGFIYFLSFCKTIGFCMLAFLLGSLLFNRDASRSFLDTCLVSLTCNVVPTLVALVWYAAAPASWAFDTIYCLAFLLYLMYITFDARGLFNHHPN